MSAVMPTCASCDADATMTLGSLSYCATCAERFLGPIRERVIERERLEGVGVRDGVDRPNHGPGACDLVCNDCGATWVGVVGADCAYCERSLERMLRWQADKLLDPELPDLEDQRCEGAVRGWAQRLTRGVEAGVITEAEARRAWNRKVTPNVAA